MQLKQLGGSQARSSSKAHKSTQRKRDTVANASLQQTERYNGLCTGRSLSLLVVSLSGLPASGNQRVQVAPTCGSLLSTCIMPPSANVESNSCRMSEKYRLVAENHKSTTLCWFLGVECLAFSRLTETCQPISTKNISPYSALGESWIMPSNCFASSSFESGGCLIRILNKQSDDPSEDD